MSSGGEGLFANVTEVVVNGLDVSYLRGGALGLGSGRRHAPPHVRPVSSGLLRETWTTP
jgi:hypothetical protein